MNDLVLKFLGEQTGKPFKVPGATNNARWMARGIYALKTYLFRQHLQLEPNFLNSLERFCMFVALIYAKHWNRSPIAVDAPFNDLKLMKELHAYGRIDAEIARVALGVHKRHLWYLSDELVVLSLFSDKVSTDDKSTMAILMLRVTTHRTENSIKHTTEIDDIQNAELHNFLSARSFFFFEHLGLSTEFLDVDPNDWNDIESFRQAEKTVLDLITVVNDSAERAVQLGANIISNQRVRSESRLQDLIVSN